MLGARVFEKQPVVLYGSRWLVSLIVQLRKIVMRRSICRGTVQHVEQVFLRHLDPAGTAGGQREVDPGIEVPGLHRQRRLKLGHRLVLSSLHQQGDAVVIVRPGIAGLEGNGAVELTRGVLEKPLLLVQEAQIVVRLRVEFVSLEEGEVMLPRVFEIPCAVIPQREIEIRVGRRGGRLSLWICDLPNRKRTGE